MEARPGEVDPFTQATMLEGDDRFQIRYDTPQHLLRATLRLQVASAIYRGQSSAAWELTTSLERALGHAPEGRDPKKVERGIQRRFIERAYDFLQQLPEPDDELGWLMLMQHYGAPTRLLDWSKSPFIALYFAYEDPNVSHDRALWGLRTTGMFADNLGRDENAWPRRDPFNLYPASILEGGQERVYYPMANYSWTRDENNALREMRRSHSYNPHLVVPSELSPRLAAQQAVFTYDAALNEGLPYRLRPDSFKVILPSAWRTRVMSSLRTMGVTPAALFPGLDGVGRAAALSASLPDELEDDMGY